MTDAERIYGAPKKADLWGVRRHRLRATAVTQSAERTHHGPEGSTAAAATAMRGDGVGAERVYRSRRLSPPRMKTQRSAPLPGHSKKRTHCGDCRKKTKRLLSTVRVFSEEANPSSAHRAKPSPGGAKGSLHERRLATVLTPEDENPMLRASLPGHSKKRTHCGGRPKKTKALLPAVRVFSEEPKLAGKASASCRLRSLRIPERTHRLRRHLAGSIAGSGRPASGSDWKCLCRVR